VEKYKEDIRQLEQKLGTAREKQRVLVQRHIHARRKKRAQEDIRRIDSSQSIIKFDEFENRIEQMEANADLVNYGKKRSLDQQIDELLSDDEIEKELEKLKSKEKDDDTTPSA
jgi:phage shock protein A